MPRVDEVLDELLFAVFGGVHLGDGAEPGVRAEYQVDPAAPPVEFARVAVVALVKLL